MVHGMATRKMIISSLTYLAEINDINFVPSPQMISNYIKSAKRELSPEIDTYATKVDVSFRMYKTCKIHVNFMHLTCFLHVGYGLVTKNLRIHCMDRI